MYTAAVRRREVNAMSVDNVGWSELKIHTPWVKQNQERVNRKYVFLEIRSNVRYVYLNSARTHSLYVGIAES